MSVSLSSDEFLGGFVPKTVYKILWGGRRAVEVISQFLCDFFRSGLDWPHAVAWATHHNGSLEQAWKGHAYILSWKSVGNIGHNFSHNMNKNCSYCISISINYIGLPRLAPLAVVLEYLLVQVSSIMCNVVGSILALHAWKTLTQQL